MNLFSVRTFKNIVSVLYTTGKFALYKLMYRDSFSYIGLQRFSPNTQVYLDKGGVIKLGRRVRVHSDTKIRSIGDGHIKIGDDTSINYNCMIVSLQYIEIGNGVEFGPNVLVYDHDHDFRNGLKNGLYVKEPVFIGDNTWIGANTVILKGTKLGSNCVVGAGSVIGGVFPDNSIIIQKRETVVLGYGSKEG